MILSDQNPSGTCYYASTWIDNYEFFSTWLVDGAHTLS